MPSGFTKFAIRMLVLSLSCAFVAAAAMQLGLLRLSAIFTISPVFLFLLLGLVLHYYLLKSLNGRPQQFINTFMGGQALKMLIHLLVLVIIAFSFPESAIHFILLYAVYYLIFTVAEVIGLSAVSRASKDI